jgi:two-component system phosphate regulon response regulator PhoB
MHFYTTEFMMAASILVVEDDRVIQELLAYNLKQSGFRLMQALDSSSALKHINHSLPDLILLDWMLPVNSGIELLRRLRANNRTSAIPIIIVTSRNQDADKELGLDSGADDYITKPFSPRELIARIRAKLRRFMPMNKLSFHAGGIEISSLGANVNGLPLNLSPTELRILQCLIANANRVYRRAELLDVIWGEHALIEERTVDVHIRRLRVALEPSGLSHQVQSVRGVGYRFSVGE